MGKKPQTPSFNFYLHKNGRKVNLKDLSAEEQEQVGIWAYKTMLKGLGYTPVKEQKLHKEETE